MATTASIYKKKSVNLLKKIGFWVVRGSFLLLVTIAMGVKPASSLQTDSTLFAVIGDYGADTQAEADVAALVKSWNPDFIVTTGDNNYPDGAASTIDRNIGKYYHEFIYPYKGNYGTGASINRFFPSLGNHDWHATNAQPYLDYFTLPGNERYYDFTRGSVHFFIIDSVSSEPDGTSSTSKQAAWLRNALAASTSKFNIVILHYPPYSSGTSHGSNKTLQWPYKDWGADAVLAGHEHNYERLLINDTLYIVNGSGGRSLYSFGSPIAGSQVRYNSDYGAMRVEAFDTSIQFQFISRTGKLIDTYTLAEPGPAPFVRSIALADPNPTNAASVKFTLTFSETVTGVDTGDFSLTSTGISGATVSSLSGSGATRTVTVNTGSGSGTIRLDLIDNDSISNSSGTKLGGSGVGNGDFTSGETYIINKDTAFLDVPTTNIFWRHIEAIYDAGITGGCSQSPRLYCPQNSVTRGEMAVFIERALDNFAPSPSPNAMFTDVPYPGMEAFTPFIEQLYNDGITAGCSQYPRMYCPNNPVTRGEMAVFIERALGNFAPTPFPNAMFTDVPYPGMEAFTPFIEQLYNDGITGGCSQSPLTFCPQNNVTRAEMAVFIVRAFKIPLP